MTLFSDPVWAEKAPQFSVPATGQRSKVADIIIVGGGFLGLTAAIHAARKGLAVIVLDAGQIGQGASGLNGGQVIPGLKYDPEWLLSHFGERGPDVVDFVASTADSVFDMIAREALDVPFSRTGWIQACHTEKAMEAARSRHRQWQAQGADVALLDGDMIRKMIGSNNYLGGFLDRRAGTINPLAFVRELARLAIASGVTILENTPCKTLRKTGAHWQALLADGREIAATKVILATNAYSGNLIEGLAQTLVPLHSFQIATAPLPDDLLATILPGEQAVSDSRRILVYYRRALGNRIILGGRGPLRLPRGPEDWRHLERALVRLFPALSGIAIEKRWFGRVALTPDHLPHVHEPEKGLVTMVGCQGRGVGLMTASGPKLVDYLLEGDPRALPFPISPITPIPFHAFRRIGVGTMISWYRLLDALES